MKHVGKSQRHLPQKAPLTHGSFEKSRLEGSGDSHKLHLCGHLIRAFARRATAWKTGDALCRLLVRRWPRPAREARALQLWATSFSFALPRPRARREPKLPVILLGLSRPSSRR